MQTQDRLKSFVLRKGRITSNQQRAIDTLWDKYIVDSTEELKNILPNTHPILDIGLDLAKPPLSYPNKNLRHLF